MDTDLFQIVTLALLVANLVALLLALSVLNRVKDALPARGTTGGAATSDVSERAVGTETAEQRWGGAAAAQDTQAAAGTDAGQPSSWSGAIAGAAIGEETGTGSISAAESVAASAGTPSSGGYATTQAAAADVATAGSTAGSMPEEQPFERDGRWWFKRGDELLVYDEGTGQWTPAPTGAASTSDASPAAALSQVSATAAVPEAEAEAGFWKCPSCGAVNGSTADSCRMCFTSRP